MSGILTALEPVFGVMLAVLILGEHISPLSGAGIALVIAAAFLAVVFPRYWDRKQAA